MKFLIINGPNLNLLGKREPGIYGENSYESLCRRLKKFAAAHASTAECFQSNHEGAILDAIHAADGVYDAIVLNPGRTPTTPTPSWTPSRRWMCPALRCTYPTSTSGRSSGTGASPHPPAWARSAAWACTATRRPCPTFSGTRRKAERTPMADWETRVVRSDGCRIAYDCRQGGRRWCSSTATGWTAPCGPPARCPGGVDGAQSRHTGPRGLPALRRLLHPSGRRGSPGRAGKGALPRPGAGGAVHGRLCRPGVRLAVRRLRRIPGGRSYPYSVGLL